MPYGGVERRVGAQVDSFIPYEEHQLGMPRRKGDAVETPPMPRAPDAVPEADPQRVPCAGGLVHDAAGRLLLIERGREPSAGAWSVPGGRCLDGERPDRACVREVEEETGLVVEVVRFAGRVERPAPDGSIYVIDDYVCRPRGGTLRAGDDAADVRWVTRADMKALPLAPELFETLDLWQVLPD